MKRPSNSRMMELWAGEKFSAMRAAGETIVDQSKLNHFIGSIFCPGPYYFFIFDFSTLGFVNIHESAADILGVPSEQLTPEQILQRVHPDDFPFVQAAEGLAYKFMFSMLSAEQIPKYKVSYSYRMKDASGTYKVFLHQAIALTMEGEEKIGQVFGSESDISHLTQAPTYKISFIGLDGEPSYFNIDVQSPDFRKSDQLFSEREIEVMVYLAEGFSTEQIAGELGISPNTVRTHRQNMIKKSGCNNTPQLISYSIRNGVI